MKSSRGETDSGSKSGVIPIILVIAIGLSGASAVLVWGLIGVFSGEPPVGDGQDSSSYGFDLSNLDIDPEALAASGNPRDFLFPLVDPMVVSGPDVAGLNASNKRKWQKEVVSGDRVLGVEIGVLRKLPFGSVSRQGDAGDSHGEVPAHVGGQGQRYQGEERTKGVVTYNIVQHAESRIIYLL